MEKTAYELLTPAELELLLALPEQEQKEIREILSLTPSELLAYREDLQRQLDTRRKREAEQEEELTRLAAYVEVCEAKNKATRLALGLERAPKSR